ncbi:MAG: SigB/SigF/SigG family RNA polymerase sigma factor [Armatimonadetes bacterium]|nr:SigB/SigF/SigG family RNA polymerase sigma factor [Armatimonadota bacterium]MDW8029536.1 SigB/SigF/SigG family RNA polymerase sigma factor [Armatimonadota bacterium]
MTDWQLKQMETEELFRLWHKTKNPKIRDELVFRYLDLAKALARRFVGRGEPLEDLIQVAIYGLINAIDRYDPERGTKFETFAYPTILGELKRHFRDTAWAIQLPRGLLELNQKAYKLVDILTQKLGRPPTIAELAQELGVSEEQVIEALDAANAYETLSLEQEVMTDEDEKPQPLEELVTMMEDETIERWKKRQLLEDAMKILDEREQKIVEMRFFEDLTQTQIAQRLGISQMHVSRLLRRALQKMQAYLKGAESKRGSRS